MTFSSGHALIIGVGTYANDQDLDVPITADDARAIWNALMDGAAAGYPPEQVTVLTDGGATRQGILDGLDHLAQRAGADATVIVFFSGHGVLLKNDMFALTTHDLRRSPDGTIAVDSVITAPELIAKLRAIRARKVLCLLNACHSGGASPETLDVAVSAATLGVSVPRRVTSAMLATGKGRVIITACQAEEFAFIGKADLTIFPKALVAALNGEGIPDRRGFIGVYDLYDRVYELVTAEAPEQQPELTVSQGVGPFPVALFQGNHQANLDVFAAPGEPTHTQAVHIVSNAESLRMLQEVLTSLPPSQVHNQTISGNARVGTAISGNVEGNITSIQGGDNVGGDQIDARGTQGFVNRPSGPVHQTYGDQITTGDISGSSGIAIGRGAQSTVRNVSTQGGDYAEGDIDKRKGHFVSGDQITFSGNISGSNINIKLTLTDVVQTINAAPHGSADQKVELQRLITQLNEALQQAPKDLQQDAEAVADEAKDLIEKATRSNPNPRQVENRANTLKQAAENIKEALPTVFAVALAIIDKIRLFIPV